MPETMDTIEVGEVVRLNSGGPWMTVTAVAAGSDIECHWFVGRDKTALDRFPPAALTKGDPALIAKESEPWGYKVG